MKTRLLKSYLIRDAAFYLVVTLSADMLDGLLWWTRLSGQTADSATLVYAGDRAVYKKGVAVRPWFAV